MLRHQPRIDQSQQAHAVDGIARGGALRHVTRDGGPTGGEVCARCVARQHHLVVGAQERGAAAPLQGQISVGVCAARQSVVGRVRVALHPLVGARQWGHAQSRIKSEGVPRFALVEGAVEVFQLRRDEVPIVQGLLQCVGDAGRIMGRAQVFADHHQLSIP